MHNSLKDDEGKHTDVLGYKFAAAKTATSRYVIRHNQTFFLLYVRWVC